MHEIRSNNSIERSSTSAALSGSIYHPIKGQVIHHALYKSTEQYILVKCEERRRELGEGVLECTGTYYRSIGIPCWHMIKERLLLERPFQHIDFHSHWHYERPSPGTEPIKPPQPILELYTRDRRRTAAAERRVHERQHILHKPAEF
jgi:hypothetical protein